MRPPPGRTAIVRIDAERTHGWQARISRRRRLPWSRGTAYRSKLFSDGRHGGKRAARRKAITWLRAQLRARVR